MATIVLLALDDPLADRIERLYGQRAQVVSWRPGFDEPADMIAAKTTATRPEVLIIGSGLEDRKALEVAAILDREQSAIGMIIAGSAQPAMLHDAMHAGVRDLLSADASDDEITRAVDAALASATRVRTAVTPSPHEAPHTPGRCITVTAPKGGCGTTTVATNLALLLAERHPGRVAVVDLDRHFGDVADVLRIRPTFSVADAATSSLEGTAARSFLSRCDTGVYALCAPPKPERAEEVTPESVERILADLVNAFDFVVVDTAAGLDEVTLTAIELADDAVLVVSNDTSSVRALCKQLATLDRLHLGGVTFHIVVSRLDEHSRVHESDIEEACGRPVDVTIPNGREVAQAQAQGHTVAMHAPRSSVVKAIGELAERLTGEKTQQHPGLHRFALRGSVR